MSCLICPTFYGQGEDRWGRLTENEPPPQQQKRLSAYYYLAREICQSFLVNAVHRKSFDERSLGMMETPWKAGVKQQGDIMWWEASRWNQVQHNYSLICVSPPSASDVHSKRHSTFHLGGKDFLLDLAFGSFTSFLVCFLSLCFNFSHNADDPMWYKTSLWALVNAADNYSWRGMYQRNCFQIQVSWAI